MKAVHGRDVEFELCYHLEFDAPLLRFLGQMLTCGALQQPCELIGKLEANRNMYYRSEIRTTEVSKSK